MIAKLATLGVLASAMLGAATALAMPAGDGRIICRPAVDDGTYHFSTLTIDYALTPIDHFGDDMYATVAGTYEIDACYWRQTGEVTGSMTPRIWYGGSFDVDLDGARFLLLRTDGGVYLWGKDGGEALPLTCEGDVPR